MKNEARTVWSFKSWRMRGTASSGPKRPCERVTGSCTPRAIHSVSASRSKVKAQAARALWGQWGAGGGSKAIAPLSVADGTGRGQRPARVEKCAYGIVESYGRLD